MKLKYYIISLVLATSCGYLASCSDDDDDKIVNSELTFGVDALRVKIGEENKTLIPDRKSTRLNSSHRLEPRMPSSA